MSLEQTIRKNYCQNCLLRKNKRIKGIFVGNNIDAKMSAGLSAECSSINPKPDSAQIWNWVWKVDIKLHACRLMELEKKYLLVYLFQVILEITCWPIPTIFQEYQEWKRGLP